MISTLNAPLDVVVVERDRHQRLLYEWELGDDGHRVVTCARSASAARLASRLCIDVVIMDGLFPAGEVERMRALFPGAAIVVHTATEAGLRSSRQTGADACLLKSSDMTQLKQTIERLATVSAVRARCA